jgi:2-polyprenyl-6-methoxyphenol hydroxylase-like FAD-dependent oxidoreductase
MKIAIIGGGPGGLYFSILTKKAMPDCQIDIYERNKPDDSFGFGVVFSDETLGEFLKRDMQSYELIRSKFAYWDDIIIARDGRKSQYCWKRILRLFPKNTFAIAATTLFRRRCEFAFRTKCRRFIPI